MDCQGDRFVRASVALDGAVVVWLAAMDREEFSRLPTPVQEAWALVAYHGLKPGDEHPTRKGWYLTGERGPDQEPLWREGRGSLGSKFRWGVLIAFFVCVAAVALGSLLYSP